MKLTDQEIESVDVAVVRLHVCRSAVVLPNACKSRFPQP